MTRTTFVDDDAAQYSDILTRLRRLEQGIPEDPHWIGDFGEPVFMNGWSNYDPATGPGRAGFYYRHNGRVYLGGVIKGGASTTTAFILPEGYRPLLEGGVTGFTVHGATAPAVVAIYPTGEVQVSNYVTGSNVTVHCFLEGVSFRHA
jgi:hypothetical protein